jgi:threonine aldolase
VKPRGHPIYPPTTLIEVENTHNRSGGIVFAQEAVERVCAAARERGLATYLDGARLWNAAVASSGTTVDLAAPFDLVAVSLSKGLGAPGGSLLAGSRELIDKAVRQRRMLGGAMRQTGIYAAAGLYALDHNIERLTEDHVNALLIARRLQKNSNVVLDPESVQTNLIVFSLAPARRRRPRLSSDARERRRLAVRIRCARSAP